MRHSLLGPQGDGKHGFSGFAGNTKRIHVVDLY